MDLLDFSLHTHNVRAIVVSVHTDEDDMCNIIIIVKAPTAWLMSGDFLYLIRESIIARRQESLVIDSVRDDISFPLMAVAWYELLAVWHAMLFSSVAVRLSLLSDTSRTVGLWLLRFHLSASPHKHIQIVAVSVLLNWVHIITYINCAGVNVYKRWFIQWLRFEYCYKPWKEVLDWDSYQRKRLKRCMCF